VETDRRVPWNVGRIRCTRELAKTVGNMAAFSCLHLRKSFCVFKSARSCSTFRIDSSRGDATRRTHVRHIFLPSRRHHSSCREYVFPAGAGVITFYALNFPRMRLAFLMRCGFVWFHWIRLRAWFVFVLWFLFQIIGTLEQKAGMSSVSSAAHLGGAVVGFLAWIVWRKTNGEPRMVE
jgi:hypothetical protein